MKLIYVGKEKDYDDRDYSNLYDGHGIMMPEVYVDFETGSIYVENIYGDLKLVNDLKNKVVYAGSNGISHNIFQNIDESEEDNTNDKNDAFPFCYGLY